MIVQDAPRPAGTSGTPILRFVNRDTRDVLIERLGFTWTTPQEPPLGWVVQDARLPQPAAYAAPGAVAILFAAGARGVTEGAFFQITIRECRVEGGWRGIAIDDTYTVDTISVWDLLADRCSFHGMRGAAISLVNHPSHYIGMPSNAIVRCFIENYSNPDSLSPGVEFSRRNVEPQVRLASQTNMRIDGLDAEGSKTTVLYAADSQIAMSALYLEHLKIGYPLRNGISLEGREGVPYAPVIGLYGGEYSLDGLHLDGSINALDTSPEPPSPPVPTFSQIIYATAGASVTVGNIRARPLANPQTADLDVADGFHVEKGDALFFHTNAVGGGALARFRTVGALHLEASSRTANKLVLFDGSLDGNTTPDAVAARVEREPRLVRVRLTFPTIPAGRTRTPTAPPPPEPALPETAEPVPSYPGARVGDLVRVAPPAGFPAGCLAQGVVTAADTVEVRVFNSGTAAATVPSGVWTVEYGRGANGALLPAGS